MVLGFFTVISKSSLWVEWSRLLCVTCREFFFFKLRLQLGSFPILPSVGSKGLEPSPVSHSHPCPGALRGGSPLSTTTPRPHGHLSSVAILLIALDKRRRCWRAVVRIMAFLLTKASAVGSEPLKDSSIQCTQLGSCGASRQVQRCHTYRSPLPQICPAPHFTKETLRWEALNSSPNSRYTAQTDRIQILSPPPGSCVVYLGVLLSLFDLSFPKGTKLTGRIQWVNAGKHPTQSLAHKWSPIDCSFK